MASGELAPQLLLGNTSTQAQEYTLRGTCPKTEISRPSNLCPLAEKCNIGVRRFTVKAISSGEARMMAEINQAEGLVKPCLADQPIGFKTVDTSPTTPQVSSPVSWRYVGFARVNTTASRS